MRKITFFLLFFLTASTTTLLAQKKNSDVSISIHDDDVDINIDIDNLGKIIEEAFTSLDGDFSVHIDDDDIDIHVDDVRINWDDFEQDLERAVEKAVKNMTIELKDIDADEVKRGHSKFNGTDMRDILDDIEDEYNREVETIDRMVIKFDHDYTYITMDITLENGREVRNIKRKIRD